eukprot:6802799-Pyramimonas_sp.AAC.1
MTEMASGRPPPEHFNDCLLVFTPKGDEPSDLVDMREKYPRGPEKGFAAGMKLGEHIASLDAECRRTGLLPAANDRLPGFFSFDVRAAIPSVARLSGFGPLPPAIPCATGWRAR